MERSTKQRNVGFGKKEGSNFEKWYDLFYDWDLIEASFTSQYGIRLRSELDMSWGEFSTLLAGIMPETPLGKIIAIRSETDKDMLKHFSKEQIRIRNEWRTRQFNKLVSIDKKTTEQQLRTIQDAFKQAFS